MKRKKICSVERILVPWKIFRKGFGSRFEFLLSTVSQFVNDFRIDGSHRSLSAGVHLCRIPVTWPSHAILWLLTTAIFSLFFLLVSWPTSPCFTASPDAPNIFLPIGGMQVPSSKWNSWAAPRSASRILTPNIFDIPVPCSVFFLIFSFSVSAVNDFLICFSFSFLFFSRRLKFHVQHFLKGIVFEKIVLSLFFFSFLFFFGNIKIEKNHVSRMEKLILYAADRSLKNF